MDSLYSDTVSIRGFRLAFSLAELNLLQLLTACIVNDYLETYTSDMVCIHSGADSSNCEMHLLKIITAID